MPASHSKSPNAAPGANNRFDALLAVGAIAICALVVTALAWTRPAMAPSHIDYRQVGHLTYSAPTSATSVYGGSSVATGQPVYTNAVKDVTVTYAYSFGSSSPSKISGTEHLVATIDNGQGVVRSFVLQPAAGFAGDSFSASGTLHLSDLQGAAAAFEQMATVDGAAAYVVSITPDVALKGSLGGAAIRTGFSEPVQFDYRPASSTSVGVFSPIHSTGGPRAASSNSTGSSSAPASTASSDPLTATAQGVVPRPGGSPATLFGLSVRNARIAGPTILVGALLALFLLGRRPIRDLTTGDEGRRISARHGAAMVEVDALPSAPNSTVELSSFEGVLKVARRLGCPILHLGGPGSVYAVVDGVTVYRYVVDGGARSAPFVPAPTMPEANGHLVHHRS